MRPRWELFPILILAIVYRSTPCDAEVTAEQVRESIRRGADYLQRKQRPNGSWDESGNYPGGVTALCTLALINSGIELSDPSVKRAVDRLRRQGPPKKTYSTALKTMVFCAANPERDFPLIQRNAKWLQQIQLESGGWTYGSQKQRADASNSQFAMLALYEAERVGVAIPVSVWRDALRYWLTLQAAKDGGWGYVAGMPATGSMSCAGIASTYIASRSLSSGDASVRQGKVFCCGLQNRDDAIERGLRWLGRNFSVTRNPTSDARRSGQTWRLYYLYGVERVGRLTGRRFLGKHDWYREGAEMFIKSQDPLEGIWRGSSAGENTPEVGTALALLFLSKGRRPVVVSKLQHSHSKDNDWNRHRSDLSHLTRYVEKRWKQNLTWQIINENVADVPDLLQTPVLFISGKTGLKLTPKEKKDLAEYVNQGGFIFAEAACKGKGFDRDFRSLMKELFPDSPMRLLPSDHPVWFYEQPVNPKYVRPLYGVDTCCRTSVVYCPENLGCYWELARGPNMEYPKQLQDEIDAVLAIGANILSYATNRQLKEKLDAPTELPSEGQDEPIRRGTLTVAKLQHGGGSDDAPAALANLLRLARTQLQLRVADERRLLLPTEPTLPDYPLVFMHGRRNFQFTVAERNAIRQYVEQGGVLFADSICASSKFADAFRREMATIFPNQPLTRIPPEHAMFSDAYRGYDLRSVTLRNPTQRAGANDPVKLRSEKIKPLLEGIEVDGQYGVIFSPYDISCALESPAVSQCKGYSHEDAARIGVNVLLYALQP